MNRIFYSFLFLSLFSFSNHILAQGTSCSDPTLACTDNQDVFTVDFFNPGNGTADPNNDYGCLAGQPNPTWLQWQVTGFGEALMEVKEYNEKNIQVAVWGPFDGYQASLDTCGNLPAPVRCTPVANKLHYLQLPLAGPGQYFIMLVTKADAGPTQLYFKEISTGSPFDCNGKLPGCGPVADDPPGCEICKPTFQATTVDYDACCAPVNGFCTAIENNQWSNFLADSSSVEIEVYGFNCLYNRGIEAVITNQNLEVISNCFISTPGNYTGTLRADGINPGERYYVMVDGVMGDACEFNLSFNYGVRVGKPDPSGPVQGPADVCPGGLVTYTVDPVAGATNYHWSIPKDIMSIVDGQGTRNLTVRIKRAGSGEVCLCPTNACYEGVAACMTVQSAPIDTTTLPDTLVCSNAFPIDIEGQSWDSAGTYQVTYTSYLGCDSIVAFTISVDPGCRSLSTLLQNDTIIKVDSVYCITDTILLEFTGGLMPTTVLDWDFGDANVIDGTGPGPFYLTYDSPGNKRILLTLTENGDTVEFGRRIRIVDLPEPPMLICDTRSMPMRICLETGGTTALPNLINVSGINGTTGRFDGSCFMVGTPSDNGTTIDIEFTVEGEIAGCNLTTTYSCDIIDCPPVEVIPSNPGTLCLSPNVAPQPLSATILNNLSNGTLNWSGPFVSPDGNFDIEAAGAGTHMVSVTYEEDGCSWTESLTLFVSESPEIYEFIIQPPLFYSETTGEISVETVITGNYNYHWYSTSTGTIGATRSVRIPNWLPGTDYCVEISNQNSCVVSDCITAGGPIFRVSPIQVICEGETTNLNVRPGNGAQFSWSPAAGLSCTDCSNPEASPTTTTRYTVTATLPDGRFGSTNVYVIVIPRVFCNFRLKDSEVEAALLHTPPIADKMTDAVIEAIVRKYNFEDHVRGDFVVFPNPSNGKFQVNATSVTSRYVVMNARGQIIKSGFPEAASFEFDLTGQPEGFYILSLQTPEGPILKRLIKQ